ncbi:MAG: type VI secretion system lipoprotein TssJ [Acidobacteriota bacterium]
MHTGKKLVWVGLLASVLGGCASAPKTDAASLPDSDKALSYTDKALAFFGIKKPETPDMPDKPDVALPDRRIRWQLAASDALNLNAQGQPVALLTRIYKLKSADAFLKAPYEAFGDPVKEKELIGDDLLESRDLQLIPGQHYESVDKVAREANFVGIVALYRAPANSRWRYAFKANKAELFGLSLGLHACAMSVQKGDPVGESIRTLKSAAVPCPQIHPVAATAANEVQP